ncbi:hypothetical protein D3C78_1819120 [compost metagenome]
MKGFDSVAVYACSGCHDAIDDRNRAAEVDWKDLLRAVAETHEALIRGGLLKIKGVA